ncbi:MAG: SRPBCC domain-containing protein [Chitinophagales bacterium]
MKGKDYNISITVDADAATAFNAINDIKGWWSTDFEGQSEKFDDVFTVRFGETFITLKIIEFIPDQKIGWHVIDGYKHWLKNKKEWHDTKMVWEIAEQENKTQIHFTHVGLVPGIECYNGCENAWNGYIKDSLFQLITAGKGKPS